MVMFTTTVGLTTVSDLLTKVFGLCLRLKEEQKACRRVHSRLNAIVTKLERMEKSGEIPPNDDIAQLAQVVEEFYRFLAVHCGRKLFARIIHHHEMMERLRDFHEDIDALFKLLSLEATSSAAEWKKQYREDRRELFAHLKRFALDSRLVQREVIDLQSRMEAFGNLTYELERRADRQNDQMLELISLLKGTIAKKSATAFGKLPLWYLSSSDVTYSRKPFARGPFESAHRGVWGRGTKVVVRCLTNDSTAVGTKAHDYFVREIEIWFKLNHPHVLRMFGACHVSSPPFIVYEDTTKLGNLGSYLKRSTVKQPRIWRLLFQAALGLEHMHNKEVVHGNLSLSNILIGADGQAKLAGFGFSSVKSSSISSTEESSETSEEKAGLSLCVPECLPRKPTFASDVHSFGLCIIEAASGQSLFGTVDDMAVSEKLKRGVILSRPSGVNGKVWELVSEMTHSSYKQRCSLHHVVKRLKILADEESRVKAKQCKMGSWCEEESAEDCGKSTPRKTISSDACNRENISPNLAPSEAFKRDANEGKFTLRVVTRPTPNLHSTKCALGFVSSSELQAAVAALDKNDDSEKAQAAATIARLSLNTSNHKNIERVGTIPLLNTLIWNGTSAQKFHAAAALRSLSQTVSSRLKIAEGRGVQNLIQLVRSGNGGQKAHAAATLMNLAKNETLRDKIRDTGGIPPLVDLASNGNDDEIEQATGALRILVISIENQARLASLNGIPLLVKLVALGTDGQKTNAAGALRNLSQNISYKTRIASAGGIAPLVSLVQYGTDDQKEHAIAALNSLASNNSNQTAIASLHAIPHLVSLLRDGQDRHTGHAVRLLWTLSAVETNRSQILSADGVSALVALTQHRDDDRSELATKILRQLGYKVRDGMPVRARWFGR